MEKLNSVRLQNASINIDIKGFLIFSREIYTQYLVLFNLMRSQLSLKISQNIQLKLQKHLGYTSDKFSLFIQVCSTSVLCNFKKLRQTKIEQILYPTTILEISKRSGFRLLKPCQLEFSDKILSLSRYVPKAYFAILKSFVRLKLRKLYPVTILGISKCSGFFPFKACHVFKSFIEQF